MKKIISVGAIIIVSTILLAGCGQQPEQQQSSQNNQPTITPVTQQSPETVLTVNNFEKIRDYLNLNNENPYRKTAKIANFDVENFGDFSPFERFSIEGQVNGKNYKFTFVIQDKNTLNVLTIRNNEPSDMDHMYSEDLMTSDEKQAAQDTVTLILEGIKTKAEATNNNASPSFCANTPTPTDIGRDIYPIEIKYINLGYLGQIFTAYNCGPERVDQIFGIEGTDYTLGSMIWLRNNPTQSLIDTFKSIGFACGDESPDTTCKEWELWNTVKIDDLMKLEPFYQNFEADDCRNCG